MKIILIKLLLFFYLFLSFLWLCERKQFEHIGLMAPMPGMVAPGIMLPGPPMMPMIPRYRWSAQGPLYVTTAARAINITTANSTAVRTAIAPISVIYTTHHQSPTQQIIKQLQL